MQRERVSRIGLAVGFLGDDTDDAPSASAVLISTAQVLAASRSFSLLTCDRADVVLCLDARPLEPFALFGVFRGNWSFLSGDGRGMRAAKTSDT